MRFINTQQPFHPLFLHKAARTDHSSTHGLCPGYPLGTSFLSKAVLVLILARFLKNNMVMKLIYVMCLGSHLSLENLFEPS